MKKVIVIGGCGHIGSWLVPQLVRAGYQTISISRGISKPYTQDAAWNAVEKVSLDRNKETAGAFEQKIAAMNADIVIDLINFRLENVKAMREALGGNVEQYIFCSSCWAEGRAEILPYNPDNSAKEPFCEYGKQKFASEQYLLSAWQNERFPATIIMPGQISGVGWDIITPWGNRLKRCFQIIRGGGTLMLPNFGMETVHHVHAEDVATLFSLAIGNAKSLGEKFYAVSGGSITLYGFAKLLFQHFGQDARVDFLPWKEWTDYVRRECAGTASADEIEHQLAESYLHLARSGFYSTQKEHELLGYSPRHTNLQTILESVDYMTRHGMLD